MEAKRKVFIIRHAKPDYPIPGKSRIICLGKIDKPLCPEGFSQAKALAVSPIVPKDQVYCSPMLRARQTALALCPNPTIIDTLTEIDLGKWENITFEDAKRDYPEIYKEKEASPFYVRIPEAESPQECLDRIRDTIDCILTNTIGDITIVTHSTAIKLLLNHLLNNDPNTYTKLIIPTASVSILEADSDRTLSIYRENIAKPLSQLEIKA